MSSFRRNLKEVSAHGNSTNNVDHFVGKYTPSKRSPLSQVSNKTLDSGCPSGPGLLLDSAERSCCSTYSSKLKSGGTVTPSKQQILWADATHCACGGHNADGVRWKEMMRLARSLGTCGGMKNGKGTPPKAAQVKGACGDLKATTSARPTVALPTLCKEWTTIISEIAKHFNIHPTSRSLIYKIKKARLVGELRISESWCQVEFTEPGPAGENTKDKSLNPGSHISLRDIKEFSFMATPGGINAGSIYQTHVIHALNGGHCPLWLERGKICCDEWLRCIPENPSTQDEMQYQQLEFRIASLDAVLKPAETLLPLIAQVEAREEVPMKLYEEAVSQAEKLSRTRQVVKEFRGKILILGALCEDLEQRATSQKAALEKTMATIHAKLTPETRWKLSALRETAKETARDNAQKLHDTIFSVQKELVTVAQSLEVVEAYKSTLGEIDQDLPSQRDELRKIEALLRDLERENGTRDLPEALPDGLMRSAELRVAQCRKARHMLMQKVLAEAVLYY